MEDTDGDGLTDTAEVEARTNPLDPGDPKEEVTSVPEFQFRLGFRAAFTLGWLTKWRKSQKAVKKMIKFGL